MSIPFPTLPEPAKRRGRGSRPRPLPISEEVVAPPVQEIEIPKAPEVKIVPKVIDNSPVVVEEVVYQPPPKIEDHHEPAKKDMGEYTVEKVEW
jgi:hypothetical protein